MIHVNVTRNRDGFIKEFELSGHAESGPKGQDLVCAAVSAVSFGSVNSVIKLCGFEPTINQGGEGGYLRVELPENLDVDLFEKAQWLLEGMLVSLETIEMDYGKYMKISQR